MNSVQQEENMRRSNSGRGLAEQAARESFQRDLQAPNIQDEDTVPSTSRTSRTGNEININSNISELSKGKENKLSQPVMERVRQMESTSRASPNIFSRFNMLFGDRISISTPPKPEQISGTESRISNDEPRRLYGQTTEQTVAYSTQDSKTLEADLAPESAPETLRSKLELESGQSLEDLRVDLEMEYKKATKSMTESLEEKRRSYQVKEQKFQDYISRKNSEITNLRNQNQQLTNDVHRLQNKLREVEKEMTMMEENHESFLRKQQEDSFKNMTSTRWLPREESKIMADLERLKVDMRSWAKTSAIKFLADLDLLDNDESMELRENLRRVCPLTNDQEPLPLELSQTKRPALVLNALLAHNLYGGLFENPFFLLQHEHKNDERCSSPDWALKLLYRHGTRTQIEDAHTWRSLTLRLLQPPIGEEDTKNASEVRSWTKQEIVGVARRLVRKFLRGPARHLVADKNNQKSVDKLQAIYQTAANLAFELWTRKTKMVCHTSETMGPQRFDPESNEVLPHSSVKYDEHEDQLKGKPISLIIHPLLMAFGTDEGKDYDQGRVWAPAEVWLDSSPGKAS